MTHNSSFTTKISVVAVCGALAVLAGCGAGSGNGDAGKARMGGAPASASATAAAIAPVAPGSIRMHFHRTQGDEAQWGVYSWDGPVNPSSAWISTRFMMTGSDSFGGYVDIPVNTAKSAIWFLVTDGGGNKNCGVDQSAGFNADIAANGQEVWLLEGDCTVYKSQPAISYGNLNQATAHWLSADTLAWPGAPAGGSYKLYYAANGGLGSDVTGVTGYDSAMDLTASATLPVALNTKYPHLMGATALTLSAQDAATVAAKASGQFAIAQFDANGKLVQVTSLQMSGMLDAVFAPQAASAQLGVTFDRNDVPTFRVWAPTAKAVSLNLYADAGGARVRQVAMTRDGASGVWRYTAPDSSLTNRYYYTYDVQVLSRWANNAIVTNTVTDPYSVSLNANSGRSFIASLDSRAMKPDGWDHHAIPRLDHAADISLYELHVRDFSAGDSSVPAGHRGKYLAFTDSGSNGMRHLRSMREAGLSHVHLLPAFDFASVNEAGCRTPDIPSAPSLALLA
jgi:pullulanase